MINKLGTFVILVAGVSVPLLGAQGFSRKQPAGRIPVRVVVVTTFEIGNDDGDTPGEFQEWVKDLPLTIVLPFPQGYHHLRYNADKQILGIVTGEGPSRMASSIMALGNDPRFDLSRSYWMIAGIAGVNPNVSTAASAAWARHVVDGGLAYEIDAREIPRGWTTGYIPFGRSLPYQSPRPPVSSTSGTNEYTLNADLVDWAYQYSSQHVMLPDDSTLQRLRAQYVGFPRAQHPPTIIEGDVLASGIFFIGTLLNSWAERWVAYWAADGIFTMSDEEDAAFMQALTFLSQAEKVDLKRVMVLRSASNFTVPPPGQTAAAQLAAEVNGTTTLSGFAESLNSTYKVGSSVVEELSRNWEIYRDHIPGAKPYK